MIVACRDGVEWAVRGCGEWTIRTAEGKQDGLSASYLHRGASWRIVLHCCASFEEGVRARWGWVTGYGYDYALEEYDRS